MLSGCISPSITKSATKVALISEQRMTTQRTTWLSALYLPNRFFWCLAGLISLLVVAFWVSSLFPVALVVLIGFLILLGVDMYRVFRSEVTIEATRQTPKVLSLSDQNIISINLYNHSIRTWQVQLIDELPVQLQERNFEVSLQLLPQQPQRYSYPLRPLERGEYIFGNIQLFVRSPFGLLERRITNWAAETVPAYPSIVQMKQIELETFNRSSTLQGVKKMRRIGHSYEFDHIKSYVRGDDYRSINWKASGRRGNLMVNKYDDERSQQIYSIIDKSRHMHMPFDGLSLMDYAINATLALSNVIIKKHDRAGLMSFANKLGTVLKADNRPEQLQQILSALYKEKAHLVESNYELLYFATRKLIRGRSLLLLYTNFESMYALERALPMLRKISAIHLLVVIFFENTEIQSFADERVRTLEDIYHQTIAKKFVTDKRAMVRKLQQHGIQSVLTPPEELSIQAVNKYMELKARGLI
jgi:uncharacterized protein (DUF58 family)